MENPVRNTDGLDQVVGSEDGKKSSDFLFP